MDEVDFSRHVDGIKEFGYTVVDKVLTDRECEIAKNALECLAEDRDFGGLECVFNKGAVFELAYRIPLLLRLVRHFLAEDAVLCAVHGSVIEPGNGGGGLHADGAVTGHLRRRSQAPADQRKRIISHAMSINTIFCISEFTCDNGATRVVPGSHHVDAIEIPDQAAERADIIEAPRGAALLFHANVWHGSSVNRSDHARYAMIAPWRRNWSRGPYELSRIVKPKVLERAGPEARAIFGFDALQPYVEHWQWDRNTGEPKPEFSHLKRD